MRIVVTDLTRFSNRQIVCLAGIDVQTGECVRPMFPSQGGRLEYLTFDSVRAHAVVPGSYLEGNFVPARALAAPHLEDHQIVGQLRTAGSASGDHFQQILEHTSFTRLRDGFGANPVNRLYALNAPPARSIITLKLDRPAAQFQLVADEGFGSVKFKAHVRDGDGFQLSWLPVTDLGFVDHIERVLAADPRVQNLNRFLQTQETLYLRIGLSREWAAPDGRNGYWVQLNGIYSFPNYREDLRIYD